MKKLLLAFSLFGMLALTACDMNNDEEPTNEEYTNVEELN